MPKASLRDRTGFIRWNNFKIKRFLAYIKHSSDKQSNFFIKLKVKFGKILAQSFPHYLVRKWGLRLCGFKVGEQVYIGPDLIVASYISEKTCDLIIRDRVSIGARVTLLLATDANWSNLMEKREPIKGTIILENDCWIGAGVIILPNITIGERAIVGAGAVVTRDVLPYTTVVGVPAKEIEEKDNSA